MKKLSPVVKWIFGVIIASLIGELLVKPLVTIIRSFSGNIITSVVNYYYISCSTANFESLVMIVITITMSAIYFGAIYTEIIKIKEITKPYKAIKELEYKIINSGNKVLEHANSKEKEEKKEEKIDLKAEQQRLLNDVNKLRHSVLMRHCGIIILVIVMIISCINFFAFKLVPCTHRIAFNETVIKITPYIEQRQVDMLKSDWTRMKSKEDYKRIDDFMNDVIEKNNLK